MKADKETILKLLNDNLVMTESDILKCIGCPRDELHKTMMNLVMDKTIDFKKLGSLSSAHKIRRHGPISFIKRYTNKRIYFTDYDNVEKWIVNNLQNKLDRRDQQIASVTLRAYGLKIDLNKYYTEE